jgi:hypothetical protein
MSHELLYTSVAPGVIPGLKGYCTVARTSDIPERLILLLEQSLSDYRYSAEGNPPEVWSHFRVREGLRELSVLSRKTPVGDHSGRPSVFAHHVVLGPDEQPVGGPAWVLGQSSADRDQPDFMLPAWDGRVGTIATGRKPRMGEREPGRCAAWERAGVDPGWAGVLAESFLASPDRPSIIVYRPDRELRPLIEDAVALLPVERRWSVTFTSYYTGLPPNVTCAWRFIVAGSAEAKQAQRSSRGLILNLEAPGEPRGGALVELARTGKRAARAVVAKPAATAAPAPARWGPSARRAQATAAASAPDDSFDHLPRAKRRRKGLSAATIAAAAAAVVLILGGVIAWQAGQSNPNVKPDVLTNESEAVAEAEPKVTEELRAPEHDVVDLKNSEPEPEPAKEAPKAVVTAEPEPDFLSMPATATRSASVKLPAAPSTQSQLESPALPLNVVLPNARRFALELRGLEDEEFRDLRLVAKSTEPGSAVTLTVFRDSGKRNAGERSATRNSSQKLAECSVKEGRLYFKWATRITESLKESAKALRDCILVVRGDQEQVSVLLRDSVVDKHELTAVTGQIRHPSSGGSLRALIIQACEVKDEDNKWRDVPEGPDRKTRELVISPQQSAQGEKKVVLRVGLVGGGLDLSASVTPSKRDIEEEIKRLGYGESKLKKDLRALDERLTDVMGAIHAAEQQLAAARSNAAFARQKQELAELGSNQSGDNDEVISANAAVARAKDSVVNRQTARSSLTQDRTRVWGEAISLQDQIRAKKEMRSLVEKWMKMPIRVKVGAVIDGKQFDVMRIGPWPSD